MGELAVANALVQTPTCEQSRLRRCPVCPAELRGCAGVIVHLRDHHPFAWQYEDSDSGWHLMDAHHNDLYEKHWRNGVPCHDFTHKYGRKNKSTYEYHIDFVTMTQTNLTTSKVRNIRRAGWNQLYQ